MKIITLFSAPTDITVFCGGENVEIEVLLCPAYFNGYNESLIALNSQDRDECKGTTDWTANPPVVRYSIGLRAVTTCASKLTVCSDDIRCATNDCRLC